MRKEMLIVLVGILALLFVADVSGRTKYDRVDTKAFSTPLLPESQFEIDSIDDPIIPWPVHIGVQQTGLINASFTDYGQFGKNFSSWNPAIYGWPDASFEVPAGSDKEYLFAGAVWVGGIVGGDTLVSTGHDGWMGLREFYPDNDQPTITRIVSPANFSMRAEFNDTNVILAGSDPEDGGRPHIPLNIDIANRSHVWQSDPENYTVIYDMVIQNIGEQQISDGYVGFYFDADVLFDGDYGGFTDDITGSIPSEHIGYVIDNDGELTTEHPVPRAFSFKMLSASTPLSVTNYNWWISNGTPSLDFGPRQKESYRDFGTGGLGTPARDDNKYYLMSFPEWDYDQIFTASIQPDDSVWMYPNQGLAADFADGYDTRFLMSYGPFDLGPGECVRLLYAIFTTDSIHVDPANLQNIYDGQPDSFLANLDFSSMLTNAAISDSLAQILLDPMLPPVGLRVMYQDTDSVVVRWDPWCFDDVTGYEIYVTEVPLDSLPYPGVIPPWLHPVSPVLYDIVDASRNSYAFTSLDPDKYYFITVANQTNSGSGSLSEPITIHLGDRAPAPQFDIEYVFAEYGNPIELVWSPPAGVDIDHYNIYRFDSIPTSLQLYHAFYDSGYYASAIPPRDSFLIDGQTYYYYAVEPYVVNSAADTTLEEFGIDEGTVYVVSAVDAHGFESEFSIYVTVAYVEPHTKDMLVITNGGGVNPPFIIYDSVKAFYDSILSGYDYDIYNWADTIAGSSDPYGIEAVDWHDFTRYHMVIVDDSWKEMSLNKNFEEETNSFTKYILSGGKLVCFSAFASMEEFNFSTSPDYYAVEHPFDSRFFGVDSIFYVGIGYFLMNSYPLVDTFFAFSGAETELPEYPYLKYDTAHTRISDFTNTWWPIDQSPPSVAVFVPDTSGQVTHIASTIPGIDSPLTGKPIGIKTVGPHSETYQFGFHLWYMDYAGARSLITLLMEGSCCQNRGNVDGFFGAGGPVDVADVTYLVAYLWEGGPPPVCLAEGNVDDVIGPFGSIDIADLTYLILYLFEGGTVPPPCQ